MEVLLKAAQVDDLLDEITTSSDAEASKPSPDIVEAALSKLNMQPDQVWCLVTPYDIQAASAAGVGMIAVRCGGIDDADLAGARRSTMILLICSHADSPLGKTA